MHFARLAPGFACVSILLACQGERVPRTPPPADPPADGTATAPQSGLPPVVNPKPKKPTAATTLDAIGLSAAALDRSADPCSDFFQFACGGWEKATPIPEDKARWVRSFSEIDERNETDLKTILATSVAIAKGSKDGLTAGGTEQLPALGKEEEKNAKKLGAFYGACMDEAAIEKDGIRAIKPLLAVARSVQNEKSVLAAVAKLQKAWIFAFFDVTNTQDYKDATKMIGGLDQNGLGLPDRDYYLKADPDMVKIREKYLAHVTAMFDLLAAEEKTKDKQSSADKAKIVLAVETALASHQKTREERREPAKMYNKVDRAGLKLLAPDLDWDGYFKELGFPKITDITVTSTTYFEAIQKVVKEQGPEAIKTYLTWAVLDQTAPLLSKKWQDQDFALAQILTGQKVQRERWKRCIDATDTALGELLAQPFVALRFGGESKTAAETYVAEIAKAFEGRLAELDWMDATTKAKAVTKLKTMAYLIGYPSKWKQYDFAVGKRHADNVFAGDGFRLKEALSKVGKPVDRVNDWYMTPPTVNAYYDPQKNQMVFPAGILQPPFYSAKATVPVNLGAMGMVVGHELTHGFDDEGSQFDDKGNLVSWWTPSVRTVFDKKGQCLVDQYAGYEVLPGVKLNGKLTLGENIADLGGMKLAFRAYRNMQSKVPTEQIADGFDEDQQFFLATGQIWCAKYREAEAKRLAAIDPHSHPRYRVNGPLSQLPEFAQAFQCKTGSKMIAKTACGVW